MAGDGVPVDGNGYRVFICIYIYTMLCCYNKEEQIRSVIPGQATLLVFYAVTISYQIALRPSAPRSEWPAVNVSAVSMVIPQQCIVCHI